MLIVVKRIVSNHERISMQFREFQKGGVDLVLGADFENVKLYPLRAGGFLRDCDLVLRVHDVWVHEQSELSGRRKHLGYNSSRLASRSTATTLTPVTLPPGLARLATRPSPTGSAAIEKMIGIAEVARLAARIGAVPPPVKITSTLRLTRSAARADNRS